MTVRSPQADEASFGVFSRLVEETVYMVGWEGFIYAAPWIVCNEIRPPSAAVILTIDSGPFSIFVSGREYRVRSAIVPPFATQSICARNGSVVSFHVTPKSRWYSSFNRLGRRRIQSLDRELFASKNLEIRRIYEGCLAPSRAADVFQAVVRLAARQVPSPVRTNPRGRRIRALLERWPQMTLNDLADELGISYHWASRLVANEFGMSLREYKTWCKQLCVFGLLHSKRSLTDIAYASGFSDSAHLSRTYQHWYGKKPSYIRNPNYVRLIRCPGA